MTTLANGEKTMNEDRPSYDQTVPFSRAGIRTLEPRSATVQLFLPRGRAAFDSVPSANTFIGAVCEGMRLLSISMAEEMDISLTPLPDGWRVTITKKAGAHDHAG